jgi:hypothetical protein
MTQEFPVEGSRTGVLLPKMRDDGENAIAQRRLQRMASAITDRELRPGRRFESHYRGVPYKAEVMPDGTITVTTGKGKQIGTGYRSLSAAGRIITRYPVNGWVFWRDVGGAKAAPKPKAKPKAKAKKVAAKKAAPAPEVPAEPAASQPAEEARAS